MLRKRILSALVLGSALVLAVGFLSTSWLALFLASLLLIGAWEWGALTGLEGSRERAIYTAGLGLVMAALYFLPEWQLGSVFWGLATLAWVAILVFESGYDRAEGGLPRWQRVLMLLGLILIPAAWLAMVELHREHPAFLLFLLAISAAADSFAYFSGKRFGKTKLAPELSPGKTREGVLGGLFGVFLVTLLFVNYMDMPLDRAIPFVLLAVLCGLVSVIGDLFESLMKREAGMKDSGWILPGHGGILDRFDSHLAVAPVFVVGLQWIAGFSIYG